MQSEDAELTTVRIIFLTRSRRRPDPFRQIADQLTTEGHRTVFIPLASATWAVRRVVTPTQSAGGLPEPIGGGSVVRFERGTDRHSQRSSARVHRC